MYDEIINRWKAANPLAVHSLGIHDMDGMLPDYSKKSVEKRIQEIKKDIGSLSQMAEPKDRIAKFEFNLILSRLKTELFTLDKQKEFTKNPLAFIFPLGMIEGSYAVRSFAPLNERIRSIIKMEKGIPHFLGNATEILEPSLARAKIMMSIGFLKGILNYYKDKLIEFVSQSDDKNLIQEWSEVNISAVEAIAKFLNILSEEYFPKAHNNFRLGEEYFLELLYHTEGVKITADKLIEIAEKDLEKNYNAMVQLGEKKGGLEAYLSKIMADHIDPENMLSEVTQSLVRTKQFLVDSDIVTIPSDNQCEAVYTPEFMRGFGFAAMNTPGPFENPEAAEAYYYITPPEPSWPEDRRKEFLKFFSRAFLEVVTVHEAWPGHYLQLLYNNQANSKIAKMFARSTALIEGWGHYTEQMIYEVGYEPFDRDDLHCGQLLGALARNVRFISAVKMHCRDMTVDESKGLFLDKAFLTEPTAEIESNRGTVNPMYLVYTLGKLMILKLREDYKKEKGDEFSLKEFHNEMLSYGSPPIIVLRKMMLKNPGTEIDVL